MKMGAQVGGCFLKRLYATCFPVLGTPVSGPVAGREEGRKKISYFSSKKEKVTPPKNELAPL